MNDALDLAYRRPFPPFASSSLATLQTDWPANQNDGCLAAIEHATYGWQLAMSSGGVWVLVPSGSAATANGGWYGGIVALATGADTTLLLGVDTRIKPAGAFTRATDEITVVDDILNGMIGYSVTCNLTSGTQGRFSVKVERFSAAAWTAVPGSARHGHVHTGTGIDYDTVSWSGPVDLAAGEKFRLRGRIEAGTGTPAISTITQGTQLSIWSGGAV